MTEEMTSTETAEPKTDNHQTPAPSLQPAPVIEPARTEPVVTTTYERQAQRRGCGVLVISTILGALFGALIALAVLAAINRGSLAYNTDDLRRDMTTAQEIQSNLSTQLESLSGQLEEVNGRLATLTSQSTESAQSLTTAQENIGQLQSDVSQIEADFEQVIEASKAVDEFLAAFRVMLEALPDNATAVEPTPTPSP